MTKEMNAYSFIDTYREAVCNMLLKREISFKFYYDWCAPKEIELTAQKLDGNWPVWSDLGIVSCALEKDEMQKLIDEAARTVPLKAIEIGFFDWSSELKGGSPGWIPTTPKSGSGWIRLCETTEAQEVDCFFISLLAYNQKVFEHLLGETRITWLLTEKKVIIPYMIELLRKRLLVLRGGIGFFNRTAGEQATCPITPGCCGGLEAWYKNAAYMIREHSSVWMGHDPEIRLIQIDGQPVVYYDSPDKSIKQMIDLVHQATPFTESMADGWIRYDSRDFDEKLRKLENDFDNFMNGPMNHRVTELFPDYAEELLAAVRYCFVRGE